MNVILWAWTFQTMTSCQRPPSIMYNILPLINSTLLTADMSLFMDKKKKEPVPNSWFSYPCPLKNVCLPASSLPSLSHLTPCIPTKSNLYFYISFLNCYERTCCMQTSYISHTNYHFLYLTFVFPKNPSTSEALCDILSQAYILWQVVVIPMHNPLSTLHGCLFTIFAAAGHLLHLHPKDLPCCGDKGPI
jgi:hypothetical protein